eukprot:1174118-Amphidinium_carterae.1
MSAAPASSSMGRPAPLPPPSQPPSPPPTQLPMDVDSGHDPTLVATASTLCEATASSAPHPST